MTDKRQYLNMFYLHSLKKSICDGSDIVDSCSNITQFIEDIDAIDEDLLEISHCGVTGLVWLLRLQFAIINSRLEDYLALLEEDTKTEEEEEKQDV